MELVIWLQILTFILNANKQGVRNFIIQYNLSIKLFQLDENFPRVSCSKPFFHIISLIFHIYSFLSRYLMDFLSSGLVVEMHKGGLTRFPEIIRRYFFEFLKESRIKHPSYRHWGSKYKNPNCWWKINFQKVTDM